MNSFYLPSSKVKVTHFIIIIFCVKHIQDLYIEALLQVFVLSLATLSMFIFVEKDLHAALRTITSRVIDSDTIFKWIFLNNFGYKSYFILAWLKSSLLSFCSGKDKLKANAFQIFLVVSLLLLILLLLLLLHFLGIFFFSHFLILWSFLNWVNPLNINLYLLWIDRFICAFFNV